LFSYVLDCQPLPFNKLFLKFCFLLSTLLATLNFKTRIKRKLRPKNYADADDDDDDDDDYEFEEEEEEEEEDDDDDGDGDDGGDAVDANGKFKI